MVLATAQTARHCRQHRGEWPQVAVSLAECHEMAVFIYYCRWHILIWNVSFRLKHELYYQRPMKAVKCTCKGCVVQPSSGILDGGAAILANLAYQLHMILGLGAALISGAC